MTGEQPLTIKDAAVALRDGSLTSAVLTKEMLDRTVRLNPALGAFVEITADAALEQAAAADDAIASGDDRGPLQGIPLAIKDIIAMKGAPTTANSKVLAPDWGAGTDAPVVARLREAGSVFVGKSTTSEFAIGLPDPATGFLVPHNPWNVEHTPAGRARAPASRSPPGSPSAGSAPTRAARSAAPPPSTATPA